MVREDVEKEIYWELATTRSEYTFFLLALDFPEG